MLRHMFSTDGQRTGVVLLADRPTQQRQYAAEAAAVVRLLFASSIPAACCLLCVSALVCTHGFACRMRF